MRMQCILALALMDVGSVAGLAQVRFEDRGPDNRGYDRREYGRGFGRESLRRDPVRSTIETLYSLDRRARVDRHEANHIRSAVRELTQFAERRDRGRFDRDSLNDAIDHVRDLARADQLHPRDRRRMADHLGDLYRLRELGFNGGARW